MSHFTVLVIGNDVKEKLSPYDENLEVESYVKYSKGELIVEKRNLSMQKIEYKKYRDMSIEEFINNWHGLSSDKYGNALSTYNPKSKWDWYQIGGRWQGKFKLNKDLKFPLKTSVGKKSLLDDNHKYKKGFVDQACFGDINWKGMELSHNLEEINKEWDETISGKGFYKPEYYIERYGNKDNFIKSRTQFKTYAIITEDGEWYEPGNMGWFGMSSATSEDEISWDNKFWERFMSRLKPDTLLTIVDCHI